MDFSGAVARADVPVVSHETGQFQVYPDYREIAKYTGVLYPYNMEVFRDRLARAGMSEQAEDFFLASGRWAAELYKADIEMDLRTEGLAGFQLLDLQDYPGQGSAYVGILDAFMDSKGLVSPERWRGFCNEVVPLLLTENSVGRRGDVDSPGEGSPLCRTFFAGNRTGMDVEGRTRARCREGRVPHSFFRTGIAGGRRYPAAGSCDRQGEEVGSGTGHRRYGL